jgi:hypothetical protein
MDSLMLKCTGALVLLAIGSMLASCGMSDDTLSTMVSAPPTSEFRTCGQLVDAIKSSIKRQAQLQELERKAGSGVGSVIAGTAYQPEYLKEHANETNMRRSAREKACKLPTTLPPHDRR